MLLPPIFSVLPLCLLVSYVLAAPTKHPPPPPTEHAWYQFRNNPTIIDELDPSVPCRNVSLLHARGTHSKGNVGTAAVFFDLLAFRMIGGYDALAVQGLAYPATFGDYLGHCFDEGVGETLAQLRRTKERCPNTKFILSGYSQGARVVREAAKLLSDEETAFVKVVLLFGDPDKKEDGENGLVQPPVGRMYNFNVLEVCHPKDTICHGEAVPARDHANYFTKDGETVANWVVQHLSIQRFKVRSETLPVIVE